MATEKTLQELHEEERAYYLREDDKLRGKKVSTLKEQHDERAANYKGIEKVKAKYRAKANTDEETPKPETFTTFTTVGVKSEVTLDKATDENLAQNSSTAQTSGNEPKQEPPKTTPTEPKTT